jgi:hypothetical protein
VWPTVSATVLLALRPAARPVVGVESIQAEELVPARAPATEVTPSKDADRYSARRGGRAVLEPGQYRLVRTRWDWDRFNRPRYPTESLLTPDNGALRLEVTLRALATEPLRADHPAPLKGLSIYEQTVRHDGRVWEWVATGGGGTDERDGVDSGDGAGGDDGAGWVEVWRARAWVRGMGFKEWPGKRY